jgi:hypothetical protein
MAAAPRPGGVILIEEPDFVTICQGGESAAVRSAFTAVKRHLEETTPMDGEYGRRALHDLTTVGFLNVEAEGRCPIVRGGHPFAAHFLRLTLERISPTFAANITRRNEREKASPPVRSKRG